MKFSLLTHANKIHIHSISYNIVEITLRLIFVELDVWTYSILKSLKNLLGKQGKWLSEPKSELFLM